MGYAPGDAIYGSFDTHDPQTGVLADATPLPTASVYREGSHEPSVAVSVSRDSTGIYSYSFSVPASWSSGDTVEVRYQATVNGITDMDSRSWVLESPPSAPASGAASPLSPVLGAGSDLLPPIVQGYAWGAIGRAGDNYNYASGDSVSLRLSSFSDRADVTPDGSTAEWLDPDEKTFRLGMTADGTLDVPPGHYEVSVAIDDSGEVYSVVLGRVSVLPADGGARQAASRSWIEMRLDRQNRGIIELLRRDERPPGELPEPGCAVADAMMTMGYDVADPLVGPSDGELAAIPAPSRALLVQLSDLLFKEHLLGSLLAVVTEQDGANRVEWSDAARGLEKAIARIRPVVATSVTGYYAPVSGYLSERPQPPDAVYEDFWRDPS